MALAYLQESKYLVGAPPVAGHLRKGEPKKKAVKNDREIEVMGKNLTWFRFASDDKNLEKRFNEVYADQIKEFGGVREIEFVVFGHKVDDVYRPCREHHVGTRLMHRCDGVICERWWDEKANQYSTEPKPCPGQCKYKIKMPIIIPALGIPASINVHSSSFWDTLNIHQNLTIIYSMFETLMGVKMILKRSLHYINKPINGVPVRSPEWLITITATEESFQKRLAQIQDRTFNNLLQPVSQLALSAGISEDAAHWEEDDDENDDEYSEPLCTPDTAAAIERLWPSVGMTSGGQLMTIAAFLKSKKWPESLSLNTQEDAQKILTWLQQRKLEKQKATPPVEVKAETETAKAEDWSKWDCGQDLAEQIVALKNDLIPKYITKEIYDAEFRDMFKDVPSEKELNVIEAKDWITMLQSWINSRAKAAAE